LFFEDYERLFEQSPFTDYFIAADPVPLDADLRSKLCAAYPGCNKFEYKGMGIFAVRH
jgi:hypothetical protein